MTPGRDENGRFIKGSKGGPGRPKRQREIEYYHILETAITPDDWRKICAKAVEQAKTGDAVARKWLADYLLGAPVQRMEHSGDNGGPLEVVITYVNRKPATDGAS